MTLQSHLVERGKTAFGEAIICCSHCHQPANYTQTVSEAGTALFELMCPDPGPGPTVTLGSWVNEAQRVAAIREFLNSRG
jgi:hypothetical protein